LPFPPIYGAAYDSVEGAAHGAVEGMVAYGAVAYGAVAYGAAAYGAVAYGMVPYGAVEASLAPTLKNSMKIRKKRTVLFYYLGLCCAILTVVNVYVIRKK